MECIKKLVSPGLKYKHVAGTFGIEIETETKEEYLHPEMTLWKIDVDHSLRNFGREYILTKPCKFKEVDKVLEEFRTKTDGLKFIEGAHSTSVHVHVNMQDENLITLANFITTFLILEDLLVNFCGAQRRSNFFCLTSRYAEGVVNDYVRTFKKIEEGKFIEAFQGLTEDYSKYAALNIVPLRSLGSIEIRTMEGTTDTKVIKRWIEIINSILEYSRAENGPEAILSNFQNINPYILVERIVGNIDDLLYPDLVKDIEENLWSAGVFVAKIDWKKIEMCEPEKIEKPMKVGKQVWDVQPVIGQPQGGIVMIDDLEGDF